MKTFRYVCAVLALLLVLAAFPVVSATAAGVSVKGPGTVKVGDTFSVKVTFSGEKIMGVDAGLSYDSSVVSFQSGNGASAGKIVLYSDGTGKTLGTTLTFKAVAAGTTSVSVRINECYDADLVSLGGGSGSTKVTVSDGKEETKAPDATKKPSADKTPQKTKDKSPPKPTATPVPVDQREMKSELSGDVVYVWHTIPKGAESPQEGWEKTRIPFGEDTVEAFVRKTDGMQLVYITDAKGDKGSLVMLRENRLQPYCPFIGREAQITLLELPEEHPEGFEEVTWNVDADHAWPALRMQDKPDLYLFYALGPDGQAGWFLYDHLLGSLSHYAQMVVEKVVEVEVTPVPTATPKPTAKPSPTPEVTPQVTQEETFDSAPIAWWLFAVTLVGLCGSWFWFLCREKLEELIKKIPMLTEKIRKLAEKIRAGSDGQPKE